MCAVAAWQCRAKRPGRALLLRFDRALHRNVRHPPHRDRLPPHVPHPAAAAGCAGLGLGHLGGGGVYDFLDRERHRTHPETDGAHTVLSAPIHSVDNSANLGQIAVRCAVGAVRAVSPALRHGLRAGWISAMLLKMVTPPGVSPALRHLQPELDTAGLGHGVERLPLLDGPDTL